MSFVVILYCHPQPLVEVAGEFSRDINTNLARSTGLLEGFFKIEKLKAPLLPGPECVGIQMTGALCIK